MTLITDYIILQYLVDPWRWECLANLQAMALSLANLPRTTWCSSPACSFWTRQCATEISRRWGHRRGCFAVRFCPHCAMDRIRQREGENGYLFGDIVPTCADCGPQLCHITPMDPCFFVSHFWHLFPREGKCDADVCHEVLKHHLRLDGELVSPQHTLVASVGRWRSPHDVYQPSATNPRLHDSSH